MNALVIQTAFAGDAILTLPMIQELKKLNENMLIDVLCIPSTKEIFEASPSVDAALVIDKRGEHKNIFAILRFIKKIKTKGYERIYSPHRSFRSAMITWLLGVNESAGFSNSSLPYIFKEVVKYDQSAHEVERNLSLIGFKSNSENWRIPPRIAVNESSREKVKAFITNNMVSDFIAIAPGSVWETKKYPAEYYKQVIEYFINQGYQTVLIGGNEDKSICDYLVINQKVINASGIFSFIETAELLRSSSLLICNDSAPSHLGMCADIPVLTIYCSTVAEFGFYPYNSKSSYLSYDGLSCKPCGIHGYSKCPINTFDCGKFLKPELVVKTANSLLDIHAKN